METRLQIIENLNLYQKLSLNTEKENLQKVITNLESWKPFIESSAEGKDFKLKRKFTKVVKHLGLTNQFQIAKLPLKAIFSEDYKSPSFKINKVHLRVIILKKQVEIHSHLFVERCSHAAHMVLDGENLQLLSVRLNHEMPCYTVKKQKLIVKVPKKDFFDLKIKNVIKPRENTEETGLFYSGKNLISDCEPFGFRNITYFIDQTENQSLFKTTIIANKIKYPILIANGEKIASGNYSKSFHFAKYKLSTPIPSYIFAMAAGHFEVYKTAYTNKSGRKINIDGYFHPGHRADFKLVIDVCKKAMKWLEDNYDLEYELKTLKIVLDKGYSGGMENKGFITINGLDCLVNPDFLTFYSYDNIIRMMSHEYFHNWFGDRVFIKNFFYSFLKEGLTTYFENEFYKDRYGNFSTRLLQVKDFWKSIEEFPFPILRKHLDSDEDPNISSIYHKGSEIFRMLSLIMGPEAFKQSIKNYLKENDLKAVNLDNFMDSIKKFFRGPAELLEQFKMWFERDEIPKVNVRLTYDPKTKIASLNITQDPKLPYFFPLEIAFYDDSGKVLMPAQVLQITKSDETFHFSNLLEKPIPSLLRNFSAPVKLNYEYTQEEVAVLVRHDNDPYARVEAAKKNNSLKIVEEMIRDDKVDPNFKAELILLKKENKNYDPSLKPLLKNYIVSEPFSYDALSIGKRNFRNGALNFFQDDQKFIIDYYKNAKCFEDRFESLKCLMLLESKESYSLAKAFLKEQHNYSTFFIISCLFSRLPVVEIEDIKEILNHPLFEKFSFDHLDYILCCCVKFNPQFDTKEGYNFVASEIQKIDKFEPESAIKLCNNLKEMELTPEIFKVLLTLSISDDLKSLIKQIVIEK